MYKLSIVLVCFFPLILIAACSSSPSPSSQPSEAKASSGLMLKLSVENLVDMSSHIVTGTVTKMECKQDAEYKSINTLVTIEVDRWLKGKPDTIKKMVTITIPGGRIGNQEVFVEDMPELANGEKVLLFLNTNQNKTYSVVGGFQGKYSITGEENAIATSVSDSLPLEDLIAQINAKL